MKKIIAAMLLVACIGCKEDFSKPVKCPLCGHEAKLTEVAATTRYYRDDNKHTVAVDRYTNTIVGATAALNYDEPQAEAE